MPGRRGLVCAGSSGVTSVPGRGLVYAGAAGAPVCAALHFKGGQGPLLCDSGGLPWTQPQKVPRSQGRGSPIVPR